MAQGSGWSLTKGTSQEVDRGGYGGEKELLGHRDRQRISEKERQRHTCRKAEREAEAVGTWPTCPRLSLVVQIDFTFQEALSGEKYRGPAPWGLLTALSASD